MNTSVQTIPETLREEFPLLGVKVNGKPLVYFDNGATVQKPRRVLDALNRYYTEQNANIHRGVHSLSQEATSLYEQSREAVRKFINAPHAQEVIFTSGTTAAVNLVASSFGRAFLNPGDEVLISAMEHHSNIVPWQMACELSGALLRVIPVNENGELLLEEYEKLLTDRTRIVSLVHVSNALGTINPVKEMVALAHQRDIPVMIDGAQAVPHLCVDVQDLDCDFYAFSSHKMYGPTGVGILYGKSRWLEAMPPYQGGGDMIKTVSFAKTEYNELPHKFEAGTPNIADGIALASAIEFIEETGYDRIAAHEEDLLHYATARLKEIEGLRIYGEAADKAGVISFLVEGVHPYDLGTLLDQQGIAVRTGHHCAQPLMDFYGIPGTVRASFAVYNTRAEVDRMIEALHKSLRMLR